jgi:hypothetical protein
MKGTTVSPAGAEEPAGVDRVAEGAGIAEVMAAGHRRAIRMVKVGNSECSS